MKRNKMSQSENFERKWEWKHGKSKRHSQHSTTTQLQPQENEKRVHVRTLSPNLLRSHALWKENVESLSNWELSSEYFPNTASKNSLKTNIYVIQLSITEFEKLKKKQNNRSISSISRNNSSKSLPWKWEYRWSSVFHSLDWYGGDDGGGGVYAVRNT
jgi:hypothetical protein